MIIVSQDKDKMVNFDNVGNINIEKCYNESLKQEYFTYDILVYIISSGIVRLSKYKTEKRAKEVLQEIIKEYRLTEITKATINRVSDDVGALAIKEVFVYEMPED